MEIMEAVDPEKIQPLDNWILVKEEVEYGWKDDKTGMVFPPSITTPPYNKIGRTIFQGEVVRVGERVKEVKKGDKIVWGFYGGNKLSNDYWIIQENKVLLKIDNWVKFF